MQQEQLKFMTQETKYEDKNIQVLTQGLKHEERQKKAFLWAHLPNYNLSSQTIFFPSAKKKLFFAVSKTRFPISLPDIETQN